MAPSVACLVFLSLIALGACFPMTCPSLEDLAPCTCKRVVYGIHVFCANFNESSHLLRAFKILRDYKMQNVILSGLCIGDVLPSTLFNEMEINELRVEKCKLKFSEPAFSGLDTSLTVLNVAEQSTIRSSEGFSLAKLTKLNELNIKANSLPKVSDDMLNGKIPNVHTVVLDDDEITEVSSNAFAKLDQLQVISIAENRIKVVQRSMFPQPATHLTRIDLSGNEIRELPLDIFRDMPNLEEIALSGNDLQTLEQNTWAPVWLQLTKLYLTDNKINCNSKLDWIRSFRQPDRLVGNCFLPKNLIGIPIKDVYSAT